MNDYLQNLMIAQSLVTRNRNKVREIREIAFWINDVDQKIDVSETEIEFWLKVENREGKTLTLFPVDGEEKVFPETLHVSDESRFRYNRTSLNQAASRQEVKIKTAGPCDCLLLDERWRFMEFKTNAGSGGLSATNNRASGEKQLARTITYCREKVGSKLDGAIIEGVLVTKPDFYPATTATLIERGTRFFLDFGARFIEMTTNEVYSV